MSILALVVLIGTSLCLFTFGANLLYLSWRSLRLPPAPPAGPLTSEPRVCVQVPIYNERYVVERVVNAACEIDWPRDQLEIQVLDDSDDATADIARALIERWRRRGVAISHVRRSSRTGYKAGALAHGMTLTDAPFLAVLDADFVPPAGFLRGLMDAFEAPRTGFAQARWGHLDEGYSWFTRVQAIGIDYHFFVEHAVRAGSGLFTSFTGTAGVWRRAAIEDAGGWSAATLTEDLDLSYRAQLRGWRAVFREGLEVPEELPVDINAYRRQQSRWATGSFQTTFHLAWPLLRSDQRAGVKWQGLMHLLAYSVGPLMLIQFACYPVLLWAAAHGDSLIAWSWAGLALSLTGLAPWAGFMVGQVRRGRRWWHFLPAVALQVLGAGMTLTVMVAFFRALRPGGEFLRTPKYRIESRGQEWRDAAYVRAGDPAALAEAGLGCLALLVSAVAFSLSVWVLALYAALLAAGLLTWAGMTAAQALQVVTLRRLGVGALTRLRLTTPAALLLGSAGLLLGVVAALGNPFEDSYHHWLIAATLAATGHLHDPLFGMEDSWLPAYHVLAAGILRLFGIWNLGALKAANVILAVLTLAAVQRLAGSPRRGWLAVFLLASNPVFLLTAGSVVAEPLLVAELTAAALAAVSRRLYLAGFLAAAACLTGTKAWLWVLAAVFGLLATRALAARPLRRPSARWLVPALAILLLLQLGFAPASHSVARAAAEVTSATARGSLPAGPEARLASFGWYVALACLPLLALAPLGLVSEARSAAGRLRLLAFHVPALGYLAAVVALVGLGVYTGSHRYVYPALPALAVLAAAALDRRPAVLTLVAAGAAGLLAIAYLPVFQSFVAANQGLVAAGTMAGRVPGRLLTDSPVAAYASHKPPAEITGSQPLPRQPDAALAWLQEAGVTSLVVENIDYYRATQVFPDLAAGRAGAPFVTLGDQADYRAPGGKTTFAYALNPPEYQAPLLDGLVACLRPTAQPAAGKTAPLQKGLTFEENGAQLAGGGMGFGVPLVRVGSTWYYPGSALTLDASTRDQEIWKKTFQLDRREVDTAGRFAGFEAVPSVGRVEVTYRISQGHVAISARALELATGVAEVVLLNEQSAQFSDFADPTQKLIGPAFGSWQPAAGDWARLRSESLGLEWSLPALPGVQMVAERELRPPEIDFAGLEYRFGPGFTGADYQVEVMKAR